MTELKILFIVPFWVAQGQRRPRVSRNAKDLEHQVRSLVYALHGSSFEPVRYLHFLH
jgi:hypothetical protein